MVRLFKQKYQYTKYTQKQTAKPWINNNNKDIVRVTGRGLYTILPVDKPKFNLNLYDVLKQSYAWNPDLSKYGFSIDKTLSNSNFQTYFNDSDKQLLFVIKGTNILNPFDIMTDVYLAAGKLKDTYRLQEAARYLQSAKRKYTPNQTVVAGHSLGGAIAQYIASGSDKVLTLDKGATLNQPTRQNETAYRTEGDIVSMLATGTTTLKNKSKLPYIPLFSEYNAHDINNIKDSNITF